MTNIYTSELTFFQKKIEWVIDLLRYNHNVDLSKYLDYKSHSHLESIGSDIQLSKSFYNDLDKGICSHHHHMHDGPYISLPSGEIDYLSSIFYLVNAIQEYGSTDLDRYGRFKYENSLQKKWRVTKRNLVWEYIQAFCEKYEIEYDKSPVNSYFLTHDIDFIYKGWKRESLHSLKKGNIVQAGNIISSRVSNDPIYANVDSFTKMESSYGVKSNFFWITQQGVCESGIDNADYSISDPLVSKMMEISTARGAEHGLHKSTLDKSYKEELEQLPDAQSSRYHYLKFSLPKAYDDIERSGIKLDSSLGFAEHYGYRNSYGMPFRPYNLKENRPYNFIEVPLMVMDTTMTDYMGLKQKEVYGEVSKWMSEVSSHTLVTILWHNPQLGEYSYREMASCYKSMLADIKNKKIKSLTISEILNRWGGDLQKEYNNG